MSSGERGLLARAEGSGKRALIKPASASKLAELLSLFTGKIL
jgi:hypothetical protein